MLVQWFSKKESTVKTSVFGAEFVNMKQGIDALRGLRYKLRMMGIPILALSCIYGDNMSVLHSSSRPESVLRKKSNSVYYHAGCESVAMGESLVGHLPSKENIADLLKKSYMSKREDPWSVIVFMIFMTNISHQW